MHGPLNVKLACVYIGILIDSKKEYYLFTTFSRTVKQLTAN